ncbi:MAG: SDR family NAD(P)-dependent oxidoreductase [Bradyrhizobium sp.]
MTETVRALAASDAAVTIATRRVDASERVAAELRATACNEAIEVRAPDLADLRSVRKFVDGWDTPLSVLIINAGIVALPELQRTAEGRELQFLSSFVGHFAFPTGLYPWLCRSEDARLACVASTGNLFAPVFRDDPDFRFIPYHPLLAYVQSKTACALLSVGITRKWNGSGIASTALNPGAVATNLQRHTGGLRTPSPIANRRSRGRDYGSSGGHTSSHRCERSLFRQLQ